MSVELELDAPAALDLLRAAAYGRGTTIEDVAADLRTGTLRAADLGPADD